MYSHFKKKPASSKSDLEVIIKERNEELRQSKVDLQERCIELERQARLLVQKDLELHKAQTALDNELKGLQSLAELNRLISLRFDVENIIQSTGKVLSNNMEIEKILFFHKIEKSAPMTLKLISGFRDKQIDEIRENKNQNIFIYYTDQKKPCVLSNSSDLSNYDNRMLTLLKVECFITIPLTTLSKNIGLIVIGSSLPYKRLSKEELKILLPMADRIVVSFENARLYEKLKNWSQTLENRVKKRTMELESSKEETENAYEKLKQTQNQLIQTEKMAAVGMLSAGIAHEINNPLAGIMGMAEAAADENDPEVYKEYLGDIIKYTERAQEIVKELSCYARETENRAYSSIDVSNVIDASIKMLKRSVNFHNIKIEKYLDDIPKILANYGELQQILTNIMMNAFHAMNGKGTLKIYSKCHDKFISIKICDTGQGIPENKLSKIFEPFYTTKEPGKGTGLGLFIVYRLIKKHNGNITVENKKGEGCCFIIKIPKSDENGR